MNFCDENEVIEPLVAWTPTVATSDIVYYNHDAIPEWKDHVLMTSLKNKRLYDLKLNESGTSVISETQFFTNWWGRLRDILIGPKGEIYLATSGSNWANTEPFTHSIVKIWNPDYVSIIVKTAFDDIANLYPNPASDRLHLLIDQKFIGLNCQIISMENKIVFEKIIDSISTEITIQNFSSGIYLCTLSNNQNIRFSKKFIIKNK
jgi:hypothetical protein